jgi:hypothetical protein
MKMLSSFDYREPILHTPGFFTTDGTAFGNSALLGFGKKNVNDKRWVRTHNNSFLDSIADFRRKMSHQPEMKPSSPLSRLLRARASAFIIQQVTLPIPTGNEGR